jgi:hypothetical protein
MVTAAYSNVADGTHQIVITGALNNVAFGIVYAVRAEELGIPADVVAPNAYVSLAPTGEGTIEQQIKDLQDRMGTAEGEIVAITAALPDMATKEEVQETLSEILAAIEALPDGQAVSAQVALNTTAIEGLQEDVSQLGQELNAELVELNAEILENNCISSIYADAFGYSNFQYNAAGLLISATIKWFDGTTGTMTITYSGNNISYIDYTYGSSTYRQTVNYTNGEITGNQVEKL